MHLTRMCILLLSIRSRGLFKSNVSSLIFCLDDLSSGETGVLKSPIILFLSMCPLRSVNTCFIYFIYIGSSKLGA